MKHKHFAVLALLLFFLFSCLSPAERAPEEFPEIPDELTEELAYEQIGFFIHAGQAEQAIEAFQKARIEDPEGEETQVLYASLLMSVLQIDDAVSTLEKVLEQNPENTDALFNLSLIDSLKNDKENQEKRLEAILTLDAEHTDANAAMGELLLSQRKPKESLPFFNKSLEADPQNLVALIGRGNALVRENEYEEAVKDLDAVIKLAPDYDYAYADKAKAKTGMNDLIEAEKYFTYAIELNPEAYFHYIDRGRLRSVLMGDPEAALEDFNKAIEIDSSYFYAYAYRAGIHYEKGNIEEAIHDYERLLADRPDYHPAYPQYAVLNYLSGNYSTARYFFHEAYKKQGRPINLALFIALCDLRAGNDKALRDFINPLINNLPRDEVHYHIGRMFIERGYDSLAIRRINDEKDPTTKTRMLIFFAEFYAHHGSNSLAYKYYTDISDRRLYGFLETYIAQQRLRQIEKDN